MVLPLIQWLISTPVNLLLPSPTTAMMPKPATARTSPAKAMPAREATHSRAPILRLRLLRRLLLSSPSLARPLRAATGLALRLKTGIMMSGNRAQGLGVQRVARRSEKAGLKGGVGSLWEGSRRSGSTHMRPQKDRRR